jgi:hypothetical protein
MAHLRQRLLDLTLWGLGLVPTFWFVTFYLYVLRARLALGRWPLPYQPDPKDLDFTVHHVLVIALLVLVIPSAIGFAAFRVFRRMLKVEQPTDRPLTFYFGATYVIWWLVARIDPGMYITWFMD